MFCSKCGKEIPGESVFCMYCGTRIVKAEEIVSENIGVSTQQKLVEAKCTNCGANLQVDDRQKAAICPFCNSAYIVEKAIQNFLINMNGNLNVQNATINVMTANIENLLERAIQYEKMGDYKTSLEYYNRILDVDITHQESKMRVERIKVLIDNYIYFQSKASKFYDGILLLKKEELVFISNKGTRSVYQLSDIQSPKYGIGRLEFIYKNNLFLEKFGCKMINQWVDILNNAKRGIYPEMKHRTIGDIEQNIKKNYSVKYRVAAIKYYQEITGAEIEEAEQVISRLLL